MSPSFNLISEPWIPCILLSGGRVELGLRDTLARAHEIREILDDSPLVTAALHRLLLAVLHRNFGPASRKEWLTLWEAGHFGEKVLDDYWERWRGRFDLFDPAHPFYQSTDQEVREAIIHPVAKLAHELASGNNDTLFDHSVNAAPQPVPPAYAARLLVATQAYALGGGVGKPFNLSHAPLLQGALVLIKGASLLHTLLLNMVVMQGDQPLPSDGKDMPAWERETIPPPTRRPPHGYLDYLTWQSRRILLLGLAGGMIDRIQLQQGDAATSETALDPMMALLCRDPAKGYLPLRFREDRAAWRDSQALVAEWNNLERRPQTVNQLAALTRLVPDLRAHPTSMDVLGVCSDQAKVNFWRHERMPLPLAYLDDPVLVGALRGCLGWAEHTGQALRSALWVLAKNLLTPIDQGEGKRDPDKNAVNDLAGSFPSERQFWAVLEVPFQELFVGLTEDIDRAQERWCDVLKRTARDAFALAADALDGSARSLKAAVQARGALERALHDEKVLPQYKEVTAHAE